MALRPYAGEIELPVTCGECGRELEAEYNKRALDLEIVLCKHCIQAAYDEGYSAGRHARG